MRIESHANPILASIRRVRRRLTVQKLLVLFARCLCVGFTLCLPLFVVDVLATVAVSPVVLVGPTVVLMGVAKLSFLAACFWLLLRPVPLGEAARQIDRVADLRDRATSALEFVRTGRDARLVELQLQDTTSHLQNVSPDQIVRYHIPPDMRVAFPLLCLLVGLAFLELPVSETLTPLPEATVEAPVEAEALMEEIEQVREEADESMDPELEEVLSQAEQILSEIQSSPLSQKQMLLKLSELSNLLTEHQSAQQAVEMELLAEAFGAISGMSPDLAVLGEALTQGDYELATDAIAQLAEALERLSGEARDGLAEGLSQVGDGLLDTPLAELGEALNNAGEALAAADLEQAEAALQLASEELSECAGAGG